MNERSSDKYTNNFQGLIQLIHTLLGPTGCIWDKDQTRESLIPMLLEETCELIDGINNQDIDNTKEEIGDVLFHMAFQICISISTSSFNEYDVFKYVIEKYIRRHPHVFGNTNISNKEEILSNWEEIKKEESQNKTSYLDGIPISLPALSYAKKIQDKASKVGFDWEQVSEIKDKIIEEFEELAAANNPTHQEEEMGDIIFTIVNAARHMGIDAENALRKSNNKFELRFKYMENIATEKGLDFKNITLLEKDRLWDEVKLKNNIL